MRLPPLCQKPQKDEDFTKINVKRTIHVIAVVFMHELLYDRSVEFNDRGQGKDILCQKV